MEFLTKQVIVNFSGGKDSSACLIWAKERFSLNQIIAIYSDIDVALPTIKEFVIQFCEEQQIKLEIIKPKYSFLELLPQKGFPKWKFPWCKKLLINDCLDEFVSKFEPCSTLRIIGGNRFQKPKWVNRYRLTRLKGF